MIVLDTSLKIYLIIYLCFTILYCFVKFSDKKALRVVNKTVLTLMFTGFAVLTIFRAGSFVFETNLLLLALIFASLGDVLLMVNFVVGGAFFGVSNLTLSILIMDLLHLNGCSFKNYFFFIFIFAAIYLLIISIFKKEKIDLGKMQKPIYGYLSTVTLHGSLSFASIILLGKVNLLPLFIGSIMFMISDFLLFIEKFNNKDKKYLSRISTIFYFPGLMLIALTSLILI